MGVKGRGPILLRGAEGGANLVRVACFVVCISFSVLASTVSAETGGAHVALGGSSPSKTLKKSDTACEAQSIPLRLVRIKESPERLLVALPNDGLGAPTPLNDEAMVNDRLQGGLCA